MTAERDAPLPVDAVLPDVIAALRGGSACVLVAPTGAGKTTRLPGALEDAGFGPVVVLEPRRLAARAAARRVARERAVDVGRAVGYHVRFDNRTSRETRITFATDGVFVRRLQADPFLDGVGAVVLDEFHERSLDVDLALAMVRRVQRDVRPDLKLVVTSATLDAEAIARYLDGAPIVRSAGRLFPVAIEHLPPSPGERGDAHPDHVARAVRHALAETAGNLLVFLPGRGEIARARAALADTARAREMALVDLYGDLSPEEQDAALEPSARRRVVLATNVAESSVTVPGVTGVVDTGLARVLRHEPSVGLDRLVLTRISRASADQRAGRAGREAPGICVRLWSAMDDRALAAFDVPEVRRADLAGAALQLLAWGERDLAAFPWLEPPRPEALESALALLALLGARDSIGVTERGRALARLPVHPRLAALLSAGARGGVPARAALAAAMLSERDPMRRSERGGRDAGAHHVSDSDVLDRVSALERFARGGARAAPELVPGAAKACLQAARQLDRLAQDAAQDARRQRADGGDEALLRALLAAFPDRLTRRRPDDPRRGVMVGGRGVRLAGESAVAEGELYVAVELDAGQGEALVRQASTVERAWVDGGATRVETRAEFDAARERVVTVRRVMLGALVLEEAEGGAADAVDPAEIERVLRAAAARDVRRALDVARPEIAGLLARLACLAEWCPELALPTFDDAALMAALADLAPGCRSFADLRRAPLEAVLRGRLTRAQLAALERDAPERIQVPSGSRIRLAYEPGLPPVLAARIQELFGLRETPRVGAGRVPVVVHLLAPNGRPQQVTADLASFWRDAYFDVKKELRRRYPKHAWPDDPLTATPETKPRRRRG
jgi:ATP-dependent helicase HrpB